MTPNSENACRIPALCWGEDTLAKEKQRPPLYNPEDYATGVRKWARKNASSSMYASSNVAELDCPRRNDSFRDYRNPMLISAGSEMTLRQFGTVSELLSKLRADLRLSYPSFVQEFVSDPHDGVTLLLELLRAVQVSQGNSNNNMNNNTSIGGTAVIATAMRIPPFVQRKALLDELTCLQCLLCCCVRYPESVRRLSFSSTGLFTLAVCIMSNVNKARIIALQLLTKACELNGTGHSAVSEAMSTLRLRFGEPVRFRFLVGMLVSAGGQGELLASGLKFVNTFLDTSGGIQRRLYIQAELEQAGLDLSIIKKILPINSSSAELVFEELDRWEKSHIDIQDLLSRTEIAEKRNDYLNDRVSLLERKIRILQEEKGVLMSLERCLKDRCSELQEEVASLKSVDDVCLIYKKKLSNNNLTAVEDEGISSSERSFSPDDAQNDASCYDLYAIKSSAEMSSDEEETTIDDVIEELKNIVNNAETEAFQEEKELALVNFKNNKESSSDCHLTDESNFSSKISMRVDVLIEGPVFEDENEIIPSNLHPHPPRKSRSLVHLYTPSEDYNKEMLYENETPYTSDEGSDSLLSTSKYHLPRITTIQTATVNDVEGLRQKSYEARLSSKKGGANADTFLGNNAISKSKSLDLLSNHVDTNVETILGSNRNCHEYKFQLLNKSQSDSGKATTLSRSTSKIFLLDGRDLKENPKLSSDSVQSDDKQHKMFLPCYDQREKEVHYYFPSVQEKCTLTNNFLIKRGRINDGLYSGFQFSKSESDGLKKYKELIKSKSHLGSTSKVTDFPSGLY